MAKLCSVMQWPLSIVVSDINLGSIKQQELNSCHRTLTNASYIYIYHSGHVMTIVCYNFLVIFVLY